MATYGKKLLDGEGNIILPKTRSSLVYMDDNSTVENKISSILSEITKIKDGTSPVKYVRDANLVNLKYGFYAPSSSDPGSNTPIRIWDAQISKSRPIDRAVNDVNAKPIHTTYMPKSGGTFTGNTIAIDKNRAGGCIRNITVKNTAESEICTDVIIFYRQ